MGFPDTNSWLWLIQKGHCVSLTGHGCSSPSVAPACVNPGICTTMGDFAVQVAQLVSLGPGVSAHAASAGPWASQENTSAAPTCWTLCPFQHLCACSAYKSCKFKHARTKHKEEKVCCFVSERVKLPDNGKRPFTVQLGRRVVLRSPQRVHPCGEHLSPPGYPAGDFFG